MIRFIHNCAIYGGAKFCDGAQFCCGVIGVVVYKLT